MPVNDMMFARVRTIRGGEPRARPRTCAGDLLVLAKGVEALLRGAGLAKEMAVLTGMRLHGKEGCAFAPLGGLGHALEGVQLHGGNVSVSFELRNLRAKLTAGATGVKNVTLKKRVEKAIKGSERISRPPP